ncbi:MAG: hypothetical protein ABSB78_13385 [Bacteroidota bacterium]
MKRQTKKSKFKHLEIIQIIIFFVAIVVALFDMIGKPARLAILLTLVFGSIGLGVSIGVYVERRRSKRRNNEEKQ